MKVREPHVAGQFYPADPETLRFFVKETLSGDSEKKAAKGVLVPHAGYAFSGETAGRTYASAALTDTVLVLCPNHTGFGSAFSIMTEGSWKTPLGEVRIDEALAKALLEEFPLLDSEESAHRTEHAVEVQLPFLQILKKNIRFVPVVIGTTEPKRLRAAGEAFSEVFKRKGPVLIIASGDMNHYEDDRTTRFKDQLAIDAMLELDEEKLEHAVKEKHISMCGFGPVYSMLVAVKRLGANKAVLVEHTTSAKMSGDFLHTVGYAGMIFS